jgi:hypothetical protein
MKHITFMVARIEATEKGEYMTVIGDNDTKLSLPAVHMDSIDIGRHIEVGLHEPSNRVQMVKVGEKTLWNYTDEEMKTQIEKEKTEKFARMKEAYEEAKAAYQEVYDQLPNIYKKRIDIRRKNGGEDFSIMYEAHELHVCEMAVTLARKLGTPEEVMRYTVLSNEERQALVPEIEIPEIGDYVGASSFENVMILAYWHLAEPGVVPYIPGTPVKLGLVPAHEYGEPPYAISRAVISELAIKNPKSSLVAMSLNAMEYMDEIDEALLDACKKANIIVVTGYSDDCVEFDGAVSDEFSEGKIGFVKEWVDDEGEKVAPTPVWVQEREEYPFPEGTPYITAQYNKDGGWTFGAENFDAHEFVVCEQGEIIGNGLVINVNALL